MTSNTQHDNAQSLVTYPIAKEAISQLAKQYMPLVIAGINDADGLAVVHKARMDVKAKRVAVEKRRKELKKDALEYGRKVDAVAKELTGLLAPIEQHLLAEEEAVQAEKDRIAAEEEAARQKIFDDRVQRLAAVEAVVNPSLLVSMSDDKFAELLAEKTAEFTERKEQEAKAEEERKEREEAEAKARAEEDARVKAAQEAESQRLAAERAKLEAERTRHEEAMAAERAKLEEQQRAAREAQEAINAESRRIAAENAERERQAELERARVEAAERGRLAEIERQKREAEDKARAEAEAKAAREREEALRPDREKLLAFVNFIETFEVPDVSGDMVSVADIITDILAQACNKMREAIND